jgi:hypothetical protein
MLARRDGMKKFSAYKIIEIILIIWLIKLPQVINFFFLAEKCDPPGNEKQTSFFWEGGGLNMESLLI